mmetsp:Transcript_13415/g.6569  ORF Transcript_13415/g.6569 Transcript_13415/m.6569 type:complete len:163 (+) Transcript_13415:53-541(+)
MRHRFFYASFFSIFLYNTSDTFCVNSTFKKSVEDILVSKLIITADIHGAYSAWNKIKFLLRDDDTLAVAGDLFGTRFIRYFGEQDYYPEKIKKEFIGLSNRKYYVYGNCDHEEFFPCQEHFVRFEFNEIAIFLQHGHIKSEIPNVDILIGGHTHTRRLEKKK